jgi:hypothetical protein
MTWAATAETSTLPLSRVMMPCDWIGMVTIRSDTCAAADQKARERLRRALALRRTF